MAQRISNTVHKGTKSNVITQRKDQRVVIVGTGTLITRCSLYAMLSLSRILQYAHRYQKQPFPISSSLTKTKAMLSLLYITMPHTDTKKKQCIFQAQSQKTNTTTSIDNKWYKWMMAKVPQWKSLNMRRKRHPVLKRKWWSKTNRDLQSYTEQLTQEQQQHTR